MSQQPWWSEGIRFECQGSGKCCQSRGQYGFVYLTLEDRQRFARYFRLTTRQFTARYCAKTDGYFHLKEEAGKPDCRFLEGKACGAYHARPSQCRTWPFWPEHMRPKAWAKEVKGFCPGIGKGPVRTAAEIQKTLKLAARDNARL
jgi:Fe-S-cluster containining protein